MTNQKINIHNEANINAIGEHNSSKCRPIICKEDGTIYSSIMDGAKLIGVSYSMLCGHMSGKYKSVKGKHYDYLENVIDNPDEMFAQLRKVVAEAAASEQRRVADAEDARKWRAYQAQLAAEAAAEAKRIEKERKAKEKNDAAVAKAKAKEARIQAKQDKLMTQLAKENNKLERVRGVLALLTGAANEDVA